MKKTILLLSLIAIFSSCTKQSSDDILINGFDDHYNEENAPQSSFIGQIEVIPLTSEHKSVVLTNPQKIVSYENRFYILDNNRLFCYGPSGKFIRFIGERGHGHGEYINIATFVVSDHTIRLLDSFKNTLIAFTTDGDFISETDAPEGILSNVADAVFETDDLLFMTNHIYNDQNEIYTRWNISTGEVSVVDKTPVKTNETKESVGKHACCNYNGNIRYILPFSDGIKSTNGQAIRFQTAKKVLTDSDLQRVTDFSIMTYAEHLDDFVGFNNIFETSNYILLTFSDMEYTVVDKKSNTCFRSNYKYYEHPASFPLLNILSSKEDTLIGMIDMEYHRNLKSKIQSYMNTPCDMESGYVLILYHTK